MKDHRKIIKILEIFLILFVWSVLLLTPILFREGNNKPVWESVFKQFETIIPLTVLIFINRFVLVPQLLFKKRQISFLVSVLSLIGFLTVGIYYYEVSDRRQNPPVERQDDAQMRPPLNDFREDNVSHNKPPQGQPEQSGPIPPFANFLLLSVLIAGFDTGLRTTLRWTKVEQEKTELEKEKVATQLALLRNQVSPHFFMNTLNNIHSLVDINSDEAKIAIIKLSKMMRYLLYETETTTLKKEIEFIESYINLMKLRFNEKVKIMISFPTFIPDKTIPPLLFISLIENAFKHGISYKDKSFINLELIIGNDRLLFVVKNSKVDKKQIDEYSGISLLNVRKRLELLYGNNCHLDILESEELFTVNMSIPL